MKKIIIILTTLAMIFLFNGCAKDKNSQKKAKKAKNEQSFNITFDDQDIGDLTFENFAITKDSNGLFVLYFDIANNTEKTIKIGNVKVNLYSEDVLVLTFLEDINTNLSSMDSIDVIENLDVTLDSVDKVEYILE